MRGTGMLVVAAPRTIAAQACHRSRIIDIGTASRRVARPRVLYGAPMRCAPEHIVWVDPGG